MFRFKSLLGIASLTAVLATPAGAASIAYEVHGYGSGFFEGQEFTDKLVSVLFNSSTSTVVPNGSGLFVNKFGVGSVTVAGIGQEILVGAYAYVTQSFEGTAVAGIATTDEGATVLATKNDAFNSYQLGPTDAIVGRAYFRPDKMFPTDVGETFQLTSIGETTFSATLSAVPLPASAPLFGAALMAFGVIGYGVKRKRESAAA